MTDPATALPDGAATDQVWVDPTGKHPAVRVPSPKVCQPRHTGCTGVEIPGVYDGVCLWEHEAGWVENRFDTPGWRESRRYQAVEDYITQNYRGWQRRRP